MHFNWPCVLCKIFQKTSKKVAVLCTQLPNKVQETQVKFQSLAANTVGINFEDTGNCVHKLCILL